MKLLFFLFISVYSYSQTAVYNKLTKEGEFKEYISKEKRHIKVGDSIRCEKKRVSSYN